VKLPRLRHNYPAASANDLYQLQVEDEIFPSQLMIGIQHYYIRPDLYDRDRYLVTMLIGHSKLHTYFRRHARREIRSREFDDRLWIFRPISLFHGNFNGFLLSHRHPHHTFIKTLDHHPAAHLELQRIATFRRVEGRSISQASMIMNSYRITCFNLLHNSVIL